MALKKKKKKKISARRQHVQEKMSAERFVWLSRFANSSLPLALLVLLFFVGGVSALLSLDMSDGLFGRMWKPWPQIVSLTVLVALFSCGAAVYINHYQSRLVLRPGRAFVIAVMFLLLLVITRGVALYPDWLYLATGTAIASALVLTIAYNQRFGMGMSVFYSILACFAAEKTGTVELFLTMAAGVVVSCFALKEVRTRMKLIEVTSMASMAVFATAAAMGLILGYDWIDLLGNAGKAAVITIAVGVIVQGFLPILEKIFGVATSMTLKDYSDANQPLLRKLAMDAPGTYSHSLLIGSIAEAAAETIGANGLLCRVGAYYHDIGKVNKPPYFAENQMGSASRHDQLSPTMSQLVIVGHVKDGIEIAREFGLPSVLRQFIETHHGTTLIEYFYNEAKKKADEKSGTVSETEFRYPGPKPKTKEAAIVMLSDTIESAVRSQTELTPTRIEVIVHNLAMKRLQDGQFDECEMTLRELSQIETSIAKSLAAHYHGRVAYPQDAAKAADKEKDRERANGRKAAEAEEPQEPVEAPRSEPPAAQAPHEGNGDTLAAREEATRPAEAHGSDAEKTQHQGQGEHDSREQQQSA